MLDLVLAQIDNATLEKQRFHPWDFISVRAAEFLNRWRKHELTAGRPKFQGELLTLCIIP